MLTQQTGLTKNAYDERLEEGQDPRRIRADLAAAPLQCDPGTCHTYQNVAFDAASEILTEAAKRPFADSVSERFFLPLGMASASYGMDGLTRAKDWARPHNGSQVRPLKETYWRVPAAAGVESNIVDFAKWMQAVMGERPDVLPTSVLRIAQTPRVNTPATIWRRACPRYFRMRNMASAGASSIMAGTSLPGIRARSMAIARR